MTKQILAFFFLLHKRAKPILPPCLLPHSPRELKPYTPPLPSPLPPRELKPYTPPLPSALALSLYPLPYPLPLSSPLSSRGE